MDATTVARTGHRQPTMTICRPSPFEVLLTRRCHRFEQAVPHAWDHEDNTAPPLEPVQDIPAHSGSVGRERVVIECDPAQAGLVRAFAAAVSRRPDPEPEIGSIPEGTGGATSGAACSASHSTGSHTEWSGVDDADLGWEAPSLTADLAAGLASVEAVERVKSALDAHALETLARMHATADAMVAAQNRALAAAVPVTPSELVVLEVATATGLGQRELATRLALATGPASRCGRLRLLLREGDTSLYRAGEVLRQTQGLPESDVDQVIDTVFAATRDGAGLSNALFRSRLRRALIALDPDRVAARRSARDRIGAFAQVDQDGTGTLTVINDAAKIAAAIDRADAAARAARAIGDPRSLNQLRADFLTDTACYGWPTPTNSRPTTSTSTAGASLDDASSCTAKDASAGSGAESEDISDATSTTGGTAGSDGAGAGAGAVAGAGADGFARLGQHPPATVRVVIPFTTLLGFTDAPCELPGHGWISAEQARALAATPGSTWQPLLAEVTTGTAIRLGTTGYRPTRAMTEHVRAVDGTCRGPGCTVPADRCDLDHDTPYPLGPTHVTNLTAKHRAHHRLKTARFWRAARGEHDDLIWDTTAGRRYVTYPHDWLEATHTPPLPRSNAITYTRWPHDRPIGPEPDPSQASDPGPPPF